ncbi:hypothetical protein [Sutterella wadsworthensis]|jgi:hypothetical protein|uniref:hypothetical protein n=1 Tax=Sutterella wadsworthensis TaxID=40545 RepID=UPI0026669E37|nr:hypothetical protein [Sutterella wadsworthensis]
MNPLLLGLFMPETALQKLEAAVGLRQLDEGILRGKNFPNLTGMTVKAMKYADFGFSRI